MAGVVAAESAGKLPEYFTSQHANLSGVLTKIANASDPDHIQLTSAEHKEFKEKLPDALKGYGDAERAKGSGGEEKSSHPVAWAIGTGLVSAAVVGLLVWALMHHHDKKLMATLAAANAQSGVQQ